MSVIYLHSLFPKAEIYALEPDPSNFRLLQKNVGSLERVHTYNIALSDKDGSDEFHIFPGRKTSASFHNRDSGGDVVQVETITLGSFMKKASLQKIDVLKFDIEGAEERIFVDIQKESAQIRYIIGEIHFDMISMDEKEVLPYFRAYETSVQYTSQKRAVIRAHRV